MSDDPKRKIDLGYGKPPPWSRFQKGKSGSPNGRPPKRKKTEEAPMPEAVDDDLRKIADREYTITENGVQITVTIGELARRAQLKSVIGGNSHAQRALLADLEAMKKRDAARQAEVVEQEKKRLAFFRDWKRSQKAAWDAASAKEKEPDEPWPHPEDFIFSEAERTCRIRGPASSSDLPFFEYCELERDIAFARSVYDREFRKPRLDVTMTLWDPIWIYWDSKLPKRWQITDAETRAARIVLTNTPRKLERAIEEDTRYARLMGAALRIPSSSKEAYKSADGALRPLVQKLGYHSLAHFEASMGRPS